MKRQATSVILFLLSIVGILVSLGCFVLAFTTKSFWNLGYMMYLFIGIFAFNFDYYFGTVFLEFIISFLCSAFFNVFIFDFSWLGITAISFAQSLLLPCIMCIIDKEDELF